MDIDDEEWQWYFDVNVMSGVCFFCYVFGGMFVWGWGWIVFVVSELGIDVFVDMMYYGVIKVVMFVFVNGLVKLMCGISVMVNSIVGGFIYLEGVVCVVEQIVLVQGLFVFELKQVIVVCNMILFLECFIELEEIVQLVLYLVSL